MRLRKFYLVLTAVLGIGILTAGGTAAYMTGYMQKTNKIGVGHVSTTIEEEFVPSVPENVDENPKYKKTVWVSNQTSAEKGYNADCYVRMSLSYSNSDIGNAVVLTNLNTTDWIYGQDGYYYYKYVLQEGKSTSPLFTGFSISSELVDSSCKAYISDFSISVYQESVQAAGFADFQEAWNYFRNPVSDL